MHEGTAVRDQKRRRDRETGRDWEAEKERTRGRERDKEIREMERDKKTERDAETVGHRHLGKVTRKGSQRFRKEKTSQVSGGASHWPAPTPTAAEGKARRKKTIGAPPPLARPQHFPGSEAWVLPFRPTRQA